MKKVSIILGAITVLLISVVFLNKKCFVDSDKYAPFLSSEKKGDKKNLLLIGTHKTDAAGHAYIAVLNSSSRVDPIQFGHAPNADVTGVEAFFSSAKPVQGGTANHEERKFSKTDSSNEPLLCYHISDDQLNVIMRMVNDEWKNKPYQLLSKDCVSFIIDVAKAMGLKTEERYKGITPKGYLLQLIEINKDDKEKFPIYIPN